MPAGLFCLGLALGLLATALVARKLQDARTDAGFWRGQFELYSSKCKAVELQCDSLYAERDDALEALDHYRGLRADDEVLGVALVEANAALLSDNKNLRALLAARGREDD